VSWTLLAACEKLGASAAAATNKAVATRRLMVFIEYPVTSGLIGNVETSPIWFDGRFFGRHSINDGVLL
jgi:hypothetical protein